MDPVLGNAPIGELRWHGVGGIHTAHGRAISARRVFHGPAAELLLVVLGLRTWADRVETAPRILLACRSAFRAPRLGDALTLDACRKFDAVPLPPVDELVVFCGEAVLVEVAAAPPRPDAETCEAWLGSLLAEETASEQPETNGASTSGASRRYVRSRDIDQA